MTRSQIVALILILIGIALFIIGVGAFVSNGDMPTYMVSVGKFGFQYWFIFLILGVCLLLMTPKRRKS
jgi:hypothetical protein